MLDDVGEAHAVSAGAQRAPRIAKRARTEEVDPGHAGHPGHHVHARGAQKAATLELGTPAARELAMHEEHHVGTLLLEHARE